MRDVLKSCHVNELFDIVEKISFVHLTEMSGFVRY